MERMLPDVKFRIEPMGGSSVAITIGVGSRLESRMEYEFDEHAQRTTERSLHRAEAARLEHRGRLYYAAHPEEAIE